jgi:hypothetical protein
LQLKKTIYATINVYLTNIEESSNY